MSKRDRRGSSGTVVANPKLKGIDGRAPSGHGTEIWDRFATFSLERGIHSMCALRTTVEWPEWVACSRLPNKKGQDKLQTTWLLTWQVRSYESAIGLP